jgi:XTP/dITP diphosphohydrolase
LLLATTNRHKLEELSYLLAPLGVTPKLPGDVDRLPKVSEDRPDFAGNARKKALSGAQASGLWTLADDSGLEVEALGGAPGVLSARFSGVDATDAQNNEKLLAELADGSCDRSARFVCALCLAHPGVVAAEIAGTARGEILNVSRGTGGFGYDPLFLFTEPGHDATGKTFAELTEAEKSEVSHRGRALRALAKKLLTLMNPKP